MGFHVPRTERPHGDRRDWRNLRAMLPYLQDYLGRMAFAIACLVAAKLATVGVPLVLKHIVDTLSEPGREALVLPLALLAAYGALRLASGAFTELRDVVFARVRYRAMRRLATRFLAHMHSLSLRFHLERKTGAISRDLDRGTRSVADVLNMMVFQILPTLIEFSLVGAILWIYYDPQFAGVTAVTVAAYVAFTLVVTEWRMPFRLRMNALDSAANNRGLDSLINYETVKYFGNESLEQERYDETLSDWEEMAVRSQSSLSLLNFGQGAIIALGVTAVMIFAAQGVVDGRMSIGDLVLVNAFLLQLFLPLGFLGVVYRSIRHSLADMDLLFRLLEQPPEIEDRSGATPLAVSEGRVVFEKVAFAYRPDRPILHGIDFELPPGQKVAVVGPSGAGKSTLARLLFRFYDVSGGRILIDGQDIREVTQASLRAAIGIVPQDTVLFNDSLYFNIAYARPSAGREEVQAAARAAHLHEFIASLPEGYDTVVGERGLKLSGGEKQRVAIARVILKNPRILVFDEATSSLDSRSERVILAALREVAQNHSTLVIAHRLSTITDADLILVLDQGRIIERGSHESLLRAEGVYAHLWALQQREKASNPGTADASPGAY